MPTKRTASRAGAIVGAHAIIYSKDADADRAFLGEVLGLKGVDVGGGWLIFSLPPSEVAVHPFDENDKHELFLLVDDVDAFVARMKEHKVRTARISAQSWGRLTKVTLPGGGQLPVYEPRHARPGRSRRS
jgi:catechol 2,3-dioxygenase-like lactoylglutathione lyase family enzyme